MRRLKKKILKRWARNAFFPGWRVFLLRRCGFAIGRDTYIADDFLVVEELSDSENVFIGDRVSIAPRVTIVTSSHPNESRIRAHITTPHAPVRIEDDAWIGLGVTILPGVTIGSGSVIGAHSVVTTDIPPGSVAAGTPAAVVTELNLRGVE